MATKTKRPSSDTPTAQTRGAEDESTEQASAGKGGTKNSAKPAARKTKRKASTRKS